MCVYHRSLGVSLLYFQGVGFTAAFGRRVYRIYVAPGEGSGVGVKRIWKNSSNLGILSEVRSRDRR